jgi:hypothetical protein
MRIGVARVAAAVVCALFTSPAIAQKAITKPGNTVSVTATIRTDRSGEAIRGLAERRRL